MGCRFWVGLRLQDDVLEVELEGHGPFDSKAAGYLPSKNGVLVLQASLLSTPGRARQIVRLRDPLALPAPQA